MEPESAYQRSPKGQSGLFDLIGYIYTNRYFELWGLTYTTIGSGELSTLSRDLVRAPKERGERELLNGEVPRKITDFQ